MVVLLSSVKFFTAVFPNIVDVKSEFMLPLIFKVHVMDVFSIGGDGSAHRLSMVLLNVIFNISPFMLKVPSCSTFCIEF